MLRNEIIMCDRHCLGKAGCSTTEEPRGCCGLDRLQVIKSHPVLLAELHQLSPGLPAIWYGLAHIVEDPHILSRNARLLSSTEKRTEDFRLGNEELAVGSSDVVRKLMWRVGWVGAGEHASGTDDRQDENAVVDLNVCQPNSFTQIGGPVSFYRHH